MVNESTENSSLLNNLIQIQIQNPQFSITLLQWLSLLHNFIQLSLNSGSLQVQILLTMCWRFAMVRISDNWEIRLNTFCKSTIPQKQFIIIIIIIVFYEFRECECVDERIKWYLHYFQLKLSKAQLTIPCFFLILDFLLLLRKHCQSYKKFTIKNIPIILKTATTLFKQLILLVSVFP